MKSQTTSGVSYTPRYNGASLVKRILRPNVNECIVFRDAVGDYYLYFELAQGHGEYLAKFRAPRGTTVEDFVKNHFWGAVKGVDMDEVPPGCRGNAYHELVEEERVWKPSASS